MSIGAAVALGAIAGAAVGILISLATDVPLVPEAGFVLGGLAGWLAGRNLKGRP